MQRKKKVCRICNKECYIFSKGRCKECATKEANYSPKKTPIKRSTKPINKVSKSQSKRLKKYMLLRNKCLEDNPICQVCKQAPSTECHHIEGKIGDNLFKSLLPVCRPCHQRIEIDVQWSYENNFSKSRIKKEE